MYLRIATGLLALMSIGSFARSRPMDAPLALTPVSAQVVRGPIQQLVIPDGPPSALLQPPPADGGQWSFSQTAAPPFEFQAGGESAGRALDCLTAAIYYEARSESVDGQRAVAQVVLNRVRNPAFPATVCGVVYQGAQRSTGCQFTFTCDGSLLAQRDPLAWGRARQVALQALAGSVYAPIGSATYYHTTAVSPYWAPSLTRLGQIGSHIFYRLGDAWSQRLDFRQAYAGEEPTPGAAALDGVGTREAAGVDSDGVDLVSVGKDTISVHRGATLAHVGVTIHRGGEATPQLQPQPIAAAMPIATATPLSAQPGDAGGVRVHRGSTSAGDEQG